MNPNKTKHLLNSGSAAIGTMVRAFTNPELIRILAVSGFDFFVIDNEHCAYNYETDAALVAMARQVGINAVVRVPEAEYPYIARTLDVGAEGIMVPRVETPAAAKIVVEAAKYPPLGKRGFGLAGHHTDYQSVSVPQAIKFFNENTLVLIQIESQQAIDCLDDLLSAGPIDGVIIGPNDLSISLGVPGEMEHSKMRAAIEKIVAGCVAHSVAPGIHFGDTETLLRWREKGMQILMYSTDERLLQNAATAGAQALRAGLERQKAEARR